MTMHPRLMPNDGETAFQEWFHTAEEARGMSQGIARQAFTAGYWSREDENRALRLDRQSLHRRISDLEQEKRETLEGLVEVRDTLEVLQVQQELVDFDQDARVKARDDVMQAVLSWWATVSSDRLRIHPRDVEKMNQIVGWYTELTTEEPDES